MRLVALHLTHRLHRNDAILRGHAVTLLDQRLETVDDDGLRNKTKAIIIKIYFGAEGPTSKRASAIDAEVRTMIQCNDVTHEYHSSC